jgi:hypothetical protein
MREALSLLDDVDSVELKLTVPDSDRTSAIAALDLDVLKAEIRQIVFFDTHDLRLSRHGVVLRARRILKGGDVIVKLRPLVPAELPGKIRRSKGFRAELDVMPGAFVCSGTLKANADNEDITQVLAGKRPIRKLFDDNQKSLYEAYAPQPIALDSLTAFGPVNTAKLKCPLPDLPDRALVAELWFYPDGSRILELSTKCAPSDVFEIISGARALLSERGIEVSADQEAKTKRALQYFARLHPANGKAHGTGRGQIH